MNLPERKTKSGGRLSRLNGKCLIKIICIMLTLALCLSGTALADALKYGSEGDAVAELQQRLAELGFYTGEIDGRFDSGTRNAVKLFQRANGLDDDGIAGDGTQQKLAQDDCVTYAVYQASQPLEW
ncbi:MAG: peptidoglycan-binding protein [Clostridia bacterium]|nr:peptidoglycan-binding protein [Clostridia bacterium]